MLNPLRSPRYLLFVITFFISILCANNHSSRSLSVYSNGVFITASDRAISSGRRVSENGIFTCKFNVTAKGPTVRSLKNFEFYENGKLLFSLDKIPGSDISISNAGYVLLFEPGDYGTCIIHCYNKNGKKLFVKIFNYAQLFGFSQKGNLFGVGTDKKLEVIGLSSGKTTCYKKGWQFDISQDETMVAVAHEGGITVYSNGKSTGEINTDMVYTRKIKLSPDNKRVGVIDKRNLHVYSLPDCKLTYSDILTGENSFRDLTLDNETVWAGVHFRGEKLSKGILKTYHLITDEITEEIQAVEPIDRQIIDKTKYKAKNKNSKYPVIPWPFSPQDQAHTLWNNYEGLNTDSDGNISMAYLHQGLDIYCTAGTRTYAVADGFVKCRLTLYGQDIYWRIAHSEEQVSGWSDGWLYAHLDKNTIQVDVGDEITQGDYIGEIIPWEVVGGHIHFARIRDQGTVWSYDDDEWGLPFNPEVALEPKGDGTPPVIVTAIQGESKFAYCRNETSTYLDTGNINGDIDIIVKLYDIVGSSEYYQPAFALYYWIKRIDNNKLIVDTTLAQIRNHSYPYFDYSHFKTFARVLYKMDNTFQPGGWFTKTKKYAHVLTNNNGDSLITEDEKDSCLHTANYGDGWHRVYVEAFDAAGNSVVDSEDVYFDNGVTELISDNQIPISEFFLGQNFPSRFSSFTNIQFGMPKTAYVSLIIYDLSGNEIKTLVSGIFQGWKLHTVKWDGSNKAGQRVNSGIYVYKLKADDFTTTRKMVLF